MKVVLRAVLFPFSFISVKDFLLHRKERKDLRKRNVSVESFHSSQTVTWTEPSWFAKFVRDKWCAERHCVPKGMWQGMRRRLEEAMNVKNSELLQLGLPFCSCLRLLSSKERGRERGKQSPHPTRQSSLSNSTWPWGARSSSGHGARGGRRWNTSVVERRPAF